MARLPVYCARSAPNRRVLLCLFSDGVDTSSWMSDEATTDLAKGMDAVFYAVTNIRPDRDEFLDRLSRETGGDVLHLGPDDDLSGVFETVLDAFRHSTCWVSCPPASPPMVGIL